MAILNARAKMRYAFIVNDMHKEGCYKCIGVKYICQWMKKTTKRQREMKEYEYRNQA